MADKLCAIGQAITLSPGVELPSGENEHRLVYIASGAAKLLVQESPGTPRAGPAATSSGPARHVMGFHFPGDIVSLQRRGEGGSSLVALSETDLLVFSADEFLDVAQDDPAVLRSVLIKSLESLQRTRTRMMRLGHQTARQRVAGFLISMAKRLCGCTHGECEFVLPMGRGDIGDSLGLTIETVSRQFTDLREEGLLSTSGRSLVALPDIDALKNEAGA
ncbi:helix-turn-helix domain-containing protein [Erythrobacter sp. GH1-10]|uniref:helix-turn-helix domain-containing protein n=1 Tax=Erythrobacter sp. GH1-10 TaxID=3349334 RepID=UPI00387802F9